MVTDESATVLHVGRRDGAVDGALTAVAGDAEDIAVSTVETQEEALATLDDEAVSCLVDSLVADEERTGFLRTVRERAESLPYLFVTDDPERADEALAAGASDVAVRHDGLSDEAVLERRLDAVLAQDISTGQQPEKQEATDELLNAIDDIFYVLDTDGFLTRWNETAKQVTGYTDEELTGMRGREFFPEEDRDQARAAMQEVFETGSATVETEIVTKDGERIPVEYTTTKLVDDDGETRGVVGVGRDITARKERERQLQRERDRLSATLDTAPYPFVHVTFEDGETVVQQLNDAFEETFGYEREMLRGEPLDKFIVPEDIDTSTEVNEPASRGETIEREIVRETADGEKRDFLFKSRPLIREDGTVEGLGAYVDITERKERIEKLNQIQSHASEVIWMSDPEKESMDFVSDSYEDVWGRSTESLRERPRSFVESIHPDDRKRLEEALAAQREDPEGYEETYRVVQPDGEVRWVHDRASGVYEDGTLTRIVGIATDITERKEREEELGYRRALLEAQAETTVDGLLLADKDGTVHYYNEQFLEMWDIPRTVVANHSDDEILSAVHDLHADPEAFRDRVAKLYDDPDAESRETIELADGRWFERYSAPVRGDDGSYYGRLWVFRDVTERKERERELRLKKRAMDEAPVGITIHDVDGSEREITYVNDGFIQIAGYGREETLGEDISMLFGAETGETERDLLVRALERGESVSQVLLLYRKDGQPFWGRISLAPVTNETGDVTRFISFLQNVTKEKEHEQEIERRLDEFGEVLAKELSAPIEDARETIQTALERDDMAEVEVADRSLERVQKLIDDLTTVHSFSVKSREVSETARDGFGTTR